MRPDVRIFPDQEALSAAAAAAIAGTIDKAAGAAGRCALVLSGGTTPRSVYALLASRWREQIPWTALHLFFGDERYVPHGDVRSNYRMAREALLDHVPCPQDHVHPMPTDFADPDAAARAYETTLRDYFVGKPARFDLVLLGLGEEGHTASLFPRSPALAERERWTAAVSVPADPPLRLTLTLAAFAHAAAIYFLVAGAKKAHALAQVLSPSADPNAYPAAAVRPDTGAVTWFVDRLAAREMSS